MTDSQNPRRRNGDFPYILLAAIVGLAVLTPCLIWGFPVGADFDNHFRFALPFYEELARGNLLPGWLAESNVGFGDPRFRFYPPFLYYLLCGFHFLTGDWYFAGIGVFALLSSLGAVGVFIWARRSMTPAYALVAAGIFTFMPYHIAQFYQASLLAEFAAAAFLPYAFAAVERILTEPDRGLLKRLADTAALAAAYSLIITTHLPTTVIGSLSLGAFALISTDWGRGRSRLVFCAAGIALGVLASAWFLSRMLPELGWIQAGHNVSSEYYDYRNNFSFSPFSPSNRNTFYASVITALTIAVLAPVSATWRELFGSEQTEPRVRRRLFAVLIISAAAILMTTDLSRPVWAVVPKLKDVQFPYRWLAIASVAGALLTAAAVTTLANRFSRREFRSFSMAVTGIFLVTITYSIYDLVYDADYLQRREFAERVVKVQGARSFNDWLPVGALEIKDVRPMKENVVVGEEFGPAGERQAEVREWESHRRVFTVGKGQGSVARLRTYYYPLWRAYDVSGPGERTPLTTSAAGDGSMLVQLPPTEAAIEVVFEEPTRTRVGVIVSMFAWLFIALLLVVGLFGRRVEHESTQ